MCGRTVEEECLKRRTEKRHSKNRIQPFLRKEYKATVTEKGYRN
jgi:hypothetical protein